MVTREDTKTIVVDVHGDSIVLNFCEMAVGHHTLRKVELSSTW